MPCAECFKGAVHDHEEPKGTIDTVYGVKTYVAGGSPASPKSAILYLPDAFGLKLVNNKLLADRYASATSTRVLMPDFLMNGGMSPSIMPKMEVAFGPLESWSFGSIVSKIWAILSLLPEAIPFLIFGRPQKRYDAILDYARTMKADLPANGKLGVAGFCWGGWPSTKLCAEPSVPGGNEPLIAAQFNGHPSYMTNPEDLIEPISKFKVPYSSAVAEKDFMFTPDIAAKVEAGLRQKIGTAEENNYEFVVHKGCKHGFCVRAEPGQEMDGYYAAVKQATEWFKRFL